MYKITKYPDGASYVKLEAYKQLYNKEGTPLNKNSNTCNYTFKINSYEDLWHLNQLVDACNSFEIIPTITIPNLIDAQADRRFNVGESSGLKLVCEFLNNMKANFKIFHPHNPEVVEALIDNVEIIDNSEFIKKIIYNEIAYGPGFPDSDKLENLILMSSDAGGFKPLMKLCDKINWRGETFSANKSREYKSGKSVLNQEIYRDDFQGKDVLIVDDICIYGGTFKGLSKLLKECNCGKLYLAVSHLTIQNFEREDNVFSYFDKVFTTNSKYDGYWVRKDGSGGILVPNLEVIKLF